MEDTELRGALEQVSELSFVEAADELSGQTPAAIAAAVDALVEADGAAVPVPLLMEHAGLDKPWHWRQVLMPAMDALELTGVVQRFTYVEPGETAKQLAYGLTGE